VKAEGPTDNKLKRRSPPAVERKQPSSAAKKSMLKGSLARIEARSNGSETARTASTLKSSSSSERLFFSRSSDQEPVTLERSPASEPREITQDYQEGRPFGFKIGAHPFEVTSADPTPKVETASAYSDGQSNPKPSTKDDVRDDDNGVHDWYKAVAGDEEAFDRLFSSIVFVDEPFE